MSARLPQVDRVLRHPLLAEALKHFRRDLLVRLVRSEIAALRQDLPASGEVPDAGEIAARALARARSLARPHLRRVLNATGIILNTNLGRSPLAPAALAALAGAAGSYCNLEIDLESGRRGKRSGHIEELLSLLTGCEGALVVNNNAAAVLLAVNCLARDREVIVSRGELIEIGGSFRLPEVIEAAGARLREVGTTNRTRVEDYARAISAATGLVVRCHRSNFEIRGFTEEATLAELVELCAARGIPVLDDLGSGVLFDLRGRGISNEPTVEETLGSGVELVTFSGDKLLGGPQAGIIVGKKSLTSMLASHPIYRALRPDKVTLYLLECTLTAYLSSTPEAYLPVLAMMSAAGDELAERAANFARQANEQLKGIRCHSQPTRAAAGGGSLPGEGLDSFGIAVTGSIPPGEMARRLRQNDPPVIAVVQDDRLLLDFRTLSPADESILLAALLALEQEPAASQIKRI